jgi:hypothetical protein
VVLSGGVLQNELLLRDVRDLLAGKTLAIWTNHAVPPNDGGISLGQAALQYAENRPAVVSSSSSANAPGKCTSEAELRRRTDCGSSGA